MKKILSAIFITVCCEAESKPDRWDIEWNGSSSGETVWGYEGE